MKLPNLNEAHVEEQKVVAYLLNAAHPDGLGKAKFFLGHGARIEDWQGFRDVLLAHAEANVVAKVRCSDKGFGDLYQIDCHVTMPDGAQPCIRSVWEIRSDDGRPRLVTAHPNDK